MLAATFKWLTHGLSRDTTAPGWKIAGAAHILSPVLVLLEPFHYAYQRIPAWTHRVQRFCEHATN